MQIIHGAAFRDSEGNLLPDARKEAVISLGPNWQAVIQAEDAVAQAVADNINDVHVLIRNVTLPGRDYDADMILVGPTGIWAIEVAYAKGIYRAQGIDWLVFNAASAEFVPAQPNLVARARDNAQAVYDYLHQHDLPVPWVNPVIVPATAQVNFRVEEPAVAVVAIGDIERFAAEDVLALEQVMSREDIKAVAETLTALHPKVETRPAKPKSQLFLGMTRPQLIAVVLMALMDVCVLCGFLFLVLRDTFF